MLTTFSNTMFGVCAIVIGFSVETAAFAQGGTFQGRLITEWLDDGRNMRLIQEFGYKSKSKTTWRVPEGTVVNGASIPQFLWSFIGSPFGDKYRKASVIHDYYCEKRSRKWQNVHKVFYEAMLDAGVPNSRAWIMYKAVERFGPRWEQPKRTCKRVNGKIDFTSCVTNSAKPKLITPDKSSDSINAFIQEMKSGEHSEVASELEKSIQ